MSWTRRDWIILLVLTLLATALRLYKLGEVPPGFQFDEAFNAIDAEQVWHGNRPLFLPANGGREALYTYIQVAIGHFLGFTVYSLRLASALAGILTIPATYWLLRTLLQRRSRNVALFTSLAITISFWHLHFSHYGIRVIVMPLLLCGIIGTFWLALHSQHQRRRWIALVAAGVLTGLAPWTHPAGRFIPFVLMGYVGWILWRYPTRRRWSWVHPLVTLVVIGAIAFLVFLPLGIEFYRHPEFFFSHASEVSIFAERVSGGRPAWRILLDNLLLVLGMFNLQGDIGGARNMPGRPVFAWPLGLAFLLGVAIWMVRLIRRRADDPDRDALVLLTGWVLVMLLPSVLSDAAPNFSRTLPSIPASFVPVGLALAWVVELPQRWRSVQTRNPIPAWSGYLFAALLVIASGLQATYDYFVRYPAMPDTYYFFDVDKLDALAKLEALAAVNNTVYLAPLWSEHATFLFLRDYSLIKSLDSGGTLVLPPPSKGAVYAFPAEKVERAQGIAEQWDGLTVELYNDRYDRPLLALVEIPADALTGWPARFEPDTPSMDTDLPAFFEDAPTLLGLQQRNNKRELRLFWQAEAPTLRSLTAFLHFIDPIGERVAQVDKLPGNGTFHTPSWTPGERVIERYDPDLNPCIRGEELTLLVGWYELAADGLRRPRVGAAGNPLGSDVAVAGKLTFPITAYAPTDLSLPPAVELAINDELTLYGYTVAGDQHAPGRSFYADLFWHVSDALRTTPITLQLQQGDTTVPLWQAIVAPEVPWHEGELICRRAYLTLPSDLSPGDYQLTLQADTDPAVPFHTVVIASE